MAGNVHEKIIIRTAKDMLAPMGLFQKGQSRTWIDDNGWFLTIVELLFELRLGTRQKFL